MRDTRVGIYGLGYVGLTTAACLLSRGYRVFGYETNRAKRERLRAGVCPIKEPGVPEIIETKAASGEFIVGEDIEEVPDVVLITVGTPTGADGKVRLSGVTEVLQQLSDRFGQSAESGKTPEIILRSTVPPGTTLAYAKRFAALAHQAKLCFYPEFLREGSAVSDFNAPPLTVVGAATAVGVGGSIKQICSDFGFDLVETTSTTAEALKYASNAYHALKVAFANELARLLTTLRCDPNSVMQLFCADRDLNISHRYLSPGAPFGGSCLPKDTLQLWQMGDERGLGFAVINGLRESNSSHFDFICRRVRRSCPKVIAILGLAFKSHTDDLRHSPSVEVIRRLAGDSPDGLQIIVHDFELNAADLFGVNEEMYQSLAVIPQLRFSSAWEQAVREADVVVVMQRDPRYREVAGLTPADVVDVASWENMG